MNRNNKITDTTMLEDFSVQGHWWLPGNENQEVSGNLYSEGQNFYLETLGVFHDFGPLSDDKVNEQYIHGITVKGEKVTLINTFTLNETQNMPGIPHQKLLIPSFIVGDHFTDLEEFKFKSVTLYGTYLTEWFQSSPFHTELINDKDGKLLNYSSTYITPEVTSYYVESINAEIKNNFIFNTTNKRNENKSFNYKEGIKLVPEGWQNYKWFEHKIFSLNRLMTLLIGEAMHLEQVIFEGEEEKDSFIGEDSPEMKRTKKYHLYLSQRNVEINEKLNSHKMMFTNLQLKDSIKDIFNNWFQKEPLLKNVYNLHFSDIFNKKADLETKLLNAVQTLEVYHRALGYGKLFDDEKKDEYISLVNELLKDTLEEDVLNTINKKISHLNEYTLNKRLTDITKERISEETRILLFNSTKNAKNFVFKLVNTRNFLTHYDEKKDMKKYSGVELFYATSILKTLSSVLLFKELGIDESEIIDTLKSNHRLLQEIPRSKTALNL
ncbi:hypothetical protein GCM10010954_14510 [Halobacillus andaensis]|uniref:ApeA N-terminal domain-containing protein n=1 Tax=Halobacillus andaensis TaxID=1176239 RepID=A0A917B3F5_HALAA|nr:HEPN domain-containing protein [Halobacillus andaensis]MBP2004255.1 hypothetical protein [Halobacillus andaensis]GGF16955.1 hypothetical protein GCM10010954_14510 [Halobacillus andaensis]